MTDPLIVGVCSIVGVCIGSLVTLAVQLKLRQEKFKEMVYKKKFSAYQHISEGMEAMAVVLAARIPWEDDPGLKIVYSPVEQEKLSQKNAKFNDLLGSSLVISPEAAEELKKVRVMHLHLAEQLFKYASNEVSRTDVLAEVPLFNEQYLKALNRMREELHIEAINEAILKTF